LALSPPNAQTIESKNVARLLKRFFDGTVEGLSTNQKEMLVRLMPEEFAFAKEYFSLHINPTRRVRKSEPRKKSPRRPR